MAKRKKTGGANESKWVTTPEAAPAGKPFCDVAYEHRCHTEDIEVLGVTFEPGQIVTYRTPQDVPTEFFQHPELRLTAVMFGVCRIDPMFRYTALTPFTFKALKAGVVEPEPEPLPDEAEPEGGE